MNVVPALLLSAALLAAPLPYYLTGLPVPMAAAASITAGLVLGAFGSVVVGVLPFPAFASASGWTLLCWIGFAVLAKRAPLPERVRVRKESIAGRLTGVLLLTLAGLLFLLYLWANAVRPPILAETLFAWSGPARGLGPVYGLPLRFSAFYYALAHSDVGWKLLWSALSGLPLLAAGGGLYAQSRGISAVAGTVFTGLFTFSLLFWGSTGQPDLALAGVALTLAWAALTPWGGRWSVLWPAAFALAWSGGFWGALAVPALAASALRKEQPAALRATEAAAAAFLLGKWLWGLSPDWRLWNDIVFYFARDAWNVARYGALTYLTFAFFLRTARRNRATANTLGMTLASLAIFVVELSSREAASPTILLHVAGNRLFTCVLLLAWFVVLYENGRDVRTLEAESKIRSAPV